MGAKEPALTDTATTDVQGRQGRIQGREERKQGGQVMTETSLEPLLATVADACALLRLSDSQVRKLLNTGELEKRYVGTHIRIPYEALKAYASGLPAEPPEDG